MMQIKDKIALITGGASGLGFEYAKELLRNGAKNVALLDVCNLTGEAAIAKLKSEFGENRAIFLLCDVTKTEQVEESFKKTIQTFNGLDIVINNAGIMDDTRYELMIDVNFTALVRSTLLAMSYMSKHKGGKGGTIVNISSVYGLYVDSFVPVYHGTKYAVRVFTESMAKHYEKTGIRFLTLCPGCTSTPMIAGIANKFLDLLDSEKTSKVFTEYPSIQPPKHVAVAMIELIQKGENGAVWVSQNNKSPTAISSFPDYSTLLVPT